MFFNISLGERFVWIHNDFIMVQPKGISLDEPSILGNT
jgi:hypothetical protein